MTRFACQSFILVLFMMLLTGVVAGQDTNRGQLLFLKSEYAPFPHPDRAQGHAYQNSLFEYEGHYNDSTVAIFIPNGFVENGTIDLVFYFHGWRNNILKSINKFELLKQFSASKKNAIFVFPEGPKNAPDSFGGQMEEKDVFKKLVNDIFYQLETEGFIDHAKPGKIVLSGHSGAFRAIAYILNRGGLTKHINEVYLFDALYGQFEKFTHWIENTNTKLINIITPNGGTYQNSLDFLENLDDWDIPYHKLKNNSVSDAELSNNRIIFIFSDLGHNEVINPFLKLFLRASSLDDIKN